MTESNNIPKHWQVKKLGEVCEKITNGANAKQHDENIGFPISRIETIWNQKIDINRVKYIKENENQFVEKYSLRYNDILFSHINSDIHLGKTAVYKSVPKVLIHGINLLLIRTNSLIDPIYFNYYLIFLRARGKFISIAQKSVNQSSINQSKLKNVDVVLPPLPEQQDIVAKIEELFSELDNGIAQLKTAQQQLKVYRQSLLKWAFEGKLSVKWRRGQTSLQTSSQLLKKIKGEREDILNSNKIKIKPIQSISEEEFAELPKLPNGAVWVKLGEILWSVKDGPHYSPKYQEHGIPFISGGNIRPNGIDFKNVKYISKELHDELSRRCKPMKMDVLYTKGGTTGIAKVNDYDIDFNVWVHVAVLKAISLINPYYLQYVLNSNHCYKQAQKYTHGVGNQDLGLTRMILITLPVFSIEEQNYIVSELESKLTVCDKIEETISNSLQQAETLRQSILKKAFEGKLVTY